MPPELSITDESGGFFSSSNKLNYKLCKSLEERICVVGMCDKLDGREEIQREDTHDGFRIDNVSALNKIHVVICKDNHVNKFSDILNVAELDFSFFHFDLPLQNFFMQDNYNREKKKCQPKYVKFSFFNNVFLTSERFFILTIDFYTF